MKKFMYAAIAALAITSCSQNEEFEAPGQNNEINFTTAVSKTTRAVITENEKFDNFTAFGYAHADAFDGTFTSTVMDKGVFTKKGSDWSTTGHYYWPTTGKVSFFAYGGATVAESEFAFTSSAGKRPTLTYTVLSDITKQEDLVVAQEINKEKEANTALAFKHALTQVYFKVKGIDAEVAYKVDKIEIKGALPTGTFTYGTDPAISIGSWGTATGTSVSYAISPNITDLVGEETAVELTTASTQILMLMPQSLTGVTIEVTYSAKKGEVEIHSADKPTVLTLSGSWEAGQKIAYTLVLSGDAINLTGTSDDTSWISKGDADLK